MKRISQLLLLPLLLLVSCAEKSTMENTAFALLTEDTITLDGQEQSFTVKVTVPDINDNVIALIPDDAIDWVSLQSIQKADGKTISLNFLCMENVSRDPRTTNITLQTAKAEEQLRITVNQSHLPILEIAQTAFTALAYEPQLIIPISVNIPIEVLINEADTWITFQEEKEGQLIFAIEPNPETVERAAEITVRQIVENNEAEPLQIKFTVTQEAKVILVHWAAQMNHARLYPRWENAAANPINNEEGTAECLIYPQDLTGDRRQCIMGVGNTMGHVAFGEKDQYGYTTEQIGFWYETLFQRAVYEFEVNKWYHIAYVWKNGDDILYINGKEYLRESGRHTVKNNPWQIDQENGRYCWWFGFSYFPNETFYGMMTEIRMWKRALTPEELNEPYHFYNIDPTKYGEDLIGYWKMETNTGTTIPNKVDNDLKSNPLYGDYNLDQYFWGVRGDEGIIYKPVALP